MIDMHCHIIPFIDDGSSSIKSSIRMIKEEIAMGVTDIICTPHFRKEMFETPIDIVIQNFNLLLKEVEKENLNIRLYLGQEIYLRQVGTLEEYFRENLVLNMNNTAYVLLEFPYTRYIDISEVVFNAKLLKNKVIIAHIERYKYIKLTDVIELKASNALIQVNAASIIGRNGLKIKNKVMKLLKNDLVDFVASDFHETRKNHLKKAYKKVQKKFGINYANKVFKENAKVLIIGK